VQKGTLAKIKRDQSGWKWASAVAMKWTVRIFVASALVLAASLYASTTYLTDGGHLMAEAQIGLWLMIGALGLVGSSISFAVIALRALARRIQS
jgi:hypothetical protein